MAKQPTGPRRVVITFGRDVTDEDVTRLQQTSDVLEARILQDDADEDHVHTHPPPPPPPPKPK